MTANDTGAGIAELLWQIRAEAATALVMVTHDESLAKRADRWVHLHAGKVEARG